MHTYLHDNSTSGAKTLDAFKNASKQATDNVSPASTAGSGGKLQENGTSTSGSASSSASAPASTGAASQLTGSAIFAGLTGVFTYLLL